MLAAFFDTKDLKHEDTKVFCFFKDANPMENASNPFE